MGEQISNHPLITKLLPTVFILLIVLFMRKRYSDRLQEQGLDINDTPNKGWPRFQKMGYVYMLLFGLLSGVWTKILPYFLGNNVEGSNPVIFISGIIVILLFCVWLYIKNR